jgi:hypothetical protein
MCLRFYSSASLSQISCFGNYRQANTASTGQKASSRQSGFIRLKYLIPFTWLVLGFSPVKLTVRQIPYDNKTHLPGNSILPVRKTLE